MTRYIHLNPIQTDAADMNPARLKAEVSLAPGKTFAFTTYLSVVTSSNSPQPKQEAEKVVAQAKNGGYPALFKEHAAEVHDFWNKWWILVPCKDLCKLYYRNAIVVAGNLRRGRYYPAVSTLVNSSYFGVGWGMDNVPLYDFMMQTGHADYAKNIFQYFRNALPDDPENAGSQIDYCFDHKPLTTKTICNCSGNYAWLMYEYYRYTQDTQFLKDTAYPVMKSMSNFWSNYASTDGGCYGMWTKRLYNGSTWKVVSYEENGVSKSAKSFGYGFAERDHVTDVVAPAKYILAKTSEVAGQLGVDVDLAAKWKKCHDALNIAQNSKTYLVYLGRGKVPGDPFPDRDIVDCAIFNAIYPTPVAVDEKKERTYLAIRNNPENFRWGFNYNQQLWAAVARLRMTDEIQWLLYDSPMKLGITLDSDGMMIGESAGGGSAGYFLMPYGLIPVAINEMLLQSYDGVVRVFPCLPGKWDNHKVCFKDLVAFDGFKVSAARDHGKTSTISIYSTAGKDCLMEMPRNWANASIIDDHGKEVLFTKTKQLRRINKANVETDIMRFPTAAGRTYKMRERSG